MKGLLAAAIGGAVSSAGTIAAQQFSTGTMPSGSVVEGTAIAGAASGVVLYLMNPPKEKVLAQQIPAQSNIIPTPMTQEQVDTEIKKQVAEQVAKNQGK